MKKVLFVLCFFVIAFSPFAVNAHPPKAMKHELEVAAQKQKNALQSTYEQLGAIAESEWARDDAIIYYGQAAQISLYGVNDGYCFTITVSNNKNDSSEECAHTENLCKKLQQILFTQFKGSKEVDISTCTRATHE